MKHRALLLVLGLFAISCATTSVDSRDEGYEAEITLKEAPPAVQSTIRRVTNGAAIEEIERETRRGLTTYEVEYRKGKWVNSMTLSSSGDVIELEERVAASKLPKAVRDAIEKRYPGAKIIAAQVVTTYEYEVLLESGKKRHGLELLASGEIEEDDDEDDEDDEDDDEEDDDEDEDD
ncbi:MAG: hypothetical protein O7E54_11820 [Planctomycetota bacterium]|nr:hypothetical protein [Planctomycetota bacterium]